MADSNSRQGTTYITPAALDWTASLHVPHDAALQRAFDAPDREGMPSIQLGRLEAGFVRWLLAARGTKRVLEIGTLAGYSALSMVRTLPADGRLVTVESDPRHAAVARRVIEAAGEAGRVEVRVGDAHQVIEELRAERPFDAMFIDADKAGYPAYVRWAAAHLAPGALLVADNVFLFGRLVADDDDARAMRAAHEIARDAFDTACVPTPDGLLVGLKKA